MSASRAEFPNHTRIGDAYVAPAPWSVETHPKDPNAHDVIDANGTVIFRGRWGTTSKADAAIASASPAMLVALRTAARALDTTLSPDAAVALAVVKAAIDLAVCTCGAAAAHRAHISQPACPALSQERQA